MRIACLQFAAELGQTEKNILTAENILKEANTADLDLLVLPELAFTGYNFPSLSAIEPHLEKAATGISSQWAKRTARRLNCVVSVGYPEVAGGALEAKSTTSTVAERNRPVVVDPERDIKTTAVRPSADGPPNYNSSITVSPEGEVLCHYRKTFLYYTDVAWARPGSGFYSGSLRWRSSGKVRRATSGAEKIYEEIRIASGICMDLNPENFTASWQAYELANHAITSDASLVIVNMAWLSHNLSPEDLVRGSEQSRKPDMNTLGYWADRLRPLVEQEDKEVVVVLANRAGIEGEVCYAGSSSVMKLGKGRIGLWGVLGKGEEALLVVDTNDEPRFVLQMVKHISGHEGDHGDEDDNDDDDDEEQ